MTSVSSMGQEEYFETYPCETCEAEPDEEHRCIECGEEITEDECDEWVGKCNVCSWGIKNY